MKKMTIILCIAVVVYSCSKGNGNPATVTGKWNVVNQIQWIVIPANGQNDKDTFPETGEIADFRTDGKMYQSYDPVVFPPNTSIIPAYDTANYTVKGDSIILGIEHYQIQTLSANKLTLHQSQKSGNGSIDFWINYTK